MAYQVDKFNGTFLVSVEDGTIDTTTDLRFVGKNYAGYGEVQNENFLHLLENFTNTTAPPKKVTGQIWFDSNSTNKKLKYYDGSKWKVAGGAEVSADAPSGLSVGEFWWDSSRKQLFTYTGTDFILVGPEASPDLGTSSVVAQVVKDDISNSHTILKLIAGGKTIAIINQDSAFTLDSSNPITDFTQIKKGITLVNTNASGVSQNDHVYWGSASNALKLGGLDASQYLLKDAPEPFTNEISFSDNGFTVGDDNDLRIRINNGDETVIENQLGKSITIRISSTVGLVTTSSDVAVFSSTGIAPSNSNIYSLGTNESRWSNVYATTVTATSLIGSLTGSSTGVHTGNVVASDSTVLVNASTKEIGYTGASIRGNLIGSLSGNVTGTASNASALSNRSASITVTPATAEIPIRDTSGNIYANGFKGIADQADQLLVAGQYRIASLTADGNTVAARDGAGDITANLFKGTATAARYADLAEKYLADKEYEPGTVVVIGGDAEVTASADGQRAIGVVSTNPAYMMNSDLEGGTYIALKGRVPVKVTGSVNKGDQLIASENGTATVFNGSANVFAIALETNDSADVKFIEAVVL